MWLMQTRRALLTAFVLQLLAGSAAARAEDSLSPYIDQLKAKMEKDGKATREPQRPPGSPDPYIQSVREKMREKGEESTPPQSNQPYIDQLKAKKPERYETDSSKGYAENEKKELQPAETGGAIQALHEGRSDLTLKRPGHIKAGIGFKMAASMSHSFTGNTSLVANEFKTIYGNGWVPDFTLFAEYKPFYSETFGSLGFIASAGISIYKADGRFAKQLVQPNGTPFPMNSRTKLTFLSVPATIGAKYQFNLTHVIRPFAIVGPTLVGLSENRNDGIGAQKALSKGITTSVGGALLLDWMNGRNSWNLYEDFGVKHYYFTVEYTKLTTISSPVDVSYSGLTAGFVFDF